MTHDEVELPVIDGQFRYPGQYPPQPTPRHFPAQGAITMKPVHSTGSQLSMNGMDNDSKGRTSDVR